MQNLVQQIEHNPSQSALWQELAQYLSQLDFIELIQYSWNKLDESSGKALIHLACQYGQLDVIKFLWNMKTRDFHSIDFNCKEKFNQMTGLHFAAREGQDDIIRFFISQHSMQNNFIDFNAQDKDGYSALHYACMNKHVHTVIAIIGLPECNVNVKDNYNRTPLHRAIEYHQLGLVKALVNRKDVQINIQDNNGWTPLHYASYNQMKTTCMILLKNGANVELKDKEGHKPLYFGYGYFEDEEGGCSCPKHSH